MLKNGTEGELEGEQVLNGKEVFMQNMISEAF